MDGCDADATKSKFTAERLIQNLTTIEENRIAVNIGSTNPNKGPLRTIELLRSLQLSFSGAGHEEPMIKGTFISSFLICFSFS